MGLEEMKKYKIKTVNDLAQAVTEDNIETLVTDLENLLCSFLALKKDVPDLELNEFTFVDDGKNDLTIHLKEKE